MNIKTISKFIIEVVILLLGIVVTNARAWLLPERMHDNQHLLFSLAYVFPSLMLLVEKVGLDDEHDRDAAQSHHNEHILQELLTGKPGLRGVGRVLRVIVFKQEHVNESWERGKE